MLQTVLAERNLHHHRKWKELPLHARSPEDRKGSREEQQQKQQQQAKRGQTRRPQERTKVRRPSERGSLPQSQRRRQVQRSQEQQRQVRQSPGRQVRPPPERPVRLPAERQTLADIVATKDLIGAKNPTVKWIPNTHQMSGILTKATAVTMTKNRMEQKNQASQGPSAQKRVAINQI